MSKKSEFVQKALSDQRSAPAYIIKPERNSVALSKAVDSSDAVYHSLGAFNSFDDILPGQSGRVEFNRGHYEHFRPGEALPRKYEDTIRYIDRIYSTISIVRNIIDLMSDFACEGINIVHPVATVDKFYKEWFKKVNGIDRSERFLSGIYRHGMVVITQLHGNVVDKNLLQNLSIAEDVKLQMDEYTPGDIPLKYIFNNPALFEHENYHEITQTPKYYIKKPKAIAGHNIFTSQLGSNFNKVPLDPKKTYVTYYKKDDWSPKPIPFMYPIIKHAIMLEKLNLADSAALDGAISKVRIFKLGDLEKEIFPGDGAFAKLDQILRSNVGGGCIDILWGPDIQLIESDTDIHKFLGQEKYIPHLSQIYEGLGIPSSFVGVGQGTTNNYISLKVLMRRLMSGRARLVDFWNHQIKLVQKSMGFAQPASLEFNHLELGDEESERTLLVQLLDRDIISAEKVRSILGFDPRIENKRIQTEYKRRKSNKMAPKVSTFHQPEKEFILKRAALERGHLSPEHVGIQKEPGTESIDSPNQERLKTLQRPNQETPSEVSKGPGGRPKGAKDQVPRKTKVFTPVSKATLDVWLARTQETIHEALKEPVLATLNKNNVREFTLADLQKFESAKFSVLFNIEPLSTVTHNSILEAANKPNNTGAYNQYLRAIESVQSEFGRKLNQLEKETLVKHIYTEYFYESND